MSEQHKKRHRENVIVWLKNNDVRVMQGQQITEEMIQRAWNRVWTEPPATSFVTPEQLEARAAHQRAVGIHQQQLQEAAEQRRYEAMSDDERELEADLMLVELSKAKLAKAKNHRQHAAVERYELELEQREAIVAEKRARLARLAERRTTDLQLQEDPDFRFALTAAEINRDILDPLSPDAVENSVFINALKSATSENYKEVVKDFSAWESQRYARKRAEALEAEAAALQQADPAMRAMNQAAIDAADAGVKSAEALARANRLQGPGDLNQ